MTLASEQRNQQFQTTVSRVWAAHGWDKESINEQAQGIRRMRLLLPQVWEQLSEQERVQLYESAKQLNTSPLSLERNLFKRYTGILSGMRAAQQLVKEKGLTGAASMAQTFTQELGGLTHVIIALQEKGSVAQVVERDEQAIYDTLPALRKYGLQLIDFERLPNHHLRLQCTVHPDVEFDYEATHHIGLALVEAIVNGGGRVGALEFIPGRAD